MDYVEFNFHGPILRSLASPTCFVQGGAFSAPGPAWREALCSLIGAEVRSVEDGAHSIVVEFDAGRIQIPKASPGAGPEIAHLVTFIHGQLNTEPMMIWENLIPTRPDTSVE